MKKYQPLIIYTLFILSGSSSAFTNDEERWLNSDDDAVISSVNEGTLEFILAAEASPVFHSINELIINHESIDTGWVTLKQCYKHIDKLPEVDITYQYRFIENLSITSKKNIESAIINQQSITLKNIQEESEICIRAKVRIFYQNPDLSFSLMNGPYHRRFLDGYYPYHLSLQIRYPDKLLNFKSMQPEKQPGYSVRHNGNRIFIDSYFKGILNTEVIFKLKK